MKKLYFTQSVLLMVLSLFLTPASFADNKIIAELTESLRHAKTDKERCKLHMFRARNHNNLGNFELAEDDFDAALQYDHKGWIHLERARFYLKYGDHKQAKKEAVAAQKETPTLEYQTQAILAQVTAIEKKEKIENNPDEILLTRRWNVSYKTRKVNSKSKSVREAYYAKNKQRRGSTRRSST